MLLLLILVILKVTFGVQEYELPETFKEASILLQKLLSTNAPALIKNVDKIKNLNLGNIDIEFVIQNIPVLYNVRENQKSNSFSFWSDSLFPFLNKKQRHNFDTKDLEANTFFHQWSAFPAVAYTSEIPSWGRTAKLLCDKQR
jgi:hypothetical protein